MTENKQALAGGAACPDDTEIVEMMFARDERALTYIQQKYCRYCHSIADNILGNHADAEECVNDTYLRAWESIPPNRPGVLASYLGMLTRRIALNRARRERADRRGGGQLPLLLDELQECIADPDAEGSDDGVLKEALERFLNALPQRTRMVFVRRYWYADSIGSIARDYGMRENAVSVLLHRTRRQLRADLSAQGICV